MCYALLHLRRVETVHLGLRWFDIKRYGITIYRRKLASYNTLGSVTDELHARDPALRDAAADGCRCRRPDS